MHRSVSLRNGKVSDVADRPDITDRERRFGLKILTPEKSFLVYCPTAEQKKAWKDDLNSVIQNLSSRGSFGGPDLAPVWVRQQIDKILPCRSQIKIPTNASYVILPLL